MLFEVVCNMSADLQVACRVQLRLLAIACLHIALECWLSAIEEAGILNMPIKLCMYSGGCTILTTIYMLCVAAVFASFETGLMNECSLEALACVHHQSSHTSVFSPIFASEGSLICCWLVVQPAPCTCLSLVSHIFIIKSTASD